MLTHFRYAVEFILDKQKTFLSEIWESWISGANEEADYKYFKQWLDNKHKEETFDLLYLCLKIWRRFVPFKKDSVEPDWHEVMLEHDSFVKSKIFIEKESLMAFKPSTSDQHWFFERTKRHTKYENFCLKLEDFEKRLQEFAQTKSESGDIAFVVPFKKIENGQTKWFVTCVCGEQMVCKRLPYDYNYDKQCLCGAFFDECLIYPSNCLLWVCQRCECNQKFHFFQKLEHQTKFFCL